VNLLGGGSVCSGAPAPVATEEDVASSALAPPIYLLADADRLSDDQIDELYEAGQAMLPGPHGLEAVVLLAHSDFVARAESMESHLLDEGLAGHLRVQQLERDEVEAFIRAQLPTGEGAKLFTAQRVALIAITSGGDPAVINRLARRMLQTKPEVPTPRVTPRQRAISLRLPAGIIICLGAACLVAWGAFERQHLGAYVGLIRDHIVPRGEPAKAPAGRVPSTLASMDSPSANRVVPPSNAASAHGAPSPEAAMDPPSVKLVVPPSNAASTHAAPSPAAAMDRPSDGAVVAPPHAGSANETMPEPPTGSGVGEKRLAAAEIAALLVRGDAFLAAGDIASARLLFERAADSGDGRAAMRMAVTYDATFLDRAGLRGLGSDPERAAFWYRRARELGEGKAEPPLGRLGTSGSDENPPKSR
jgi:hypothetical protein